MQIVLILVGIVVWLSIFWIGSIALEATCYATGRLPNWLRLRPSASTRNI